MNTMSKLFNTLLGGGLGLLLSLVAISPAGAQSCVQPPAGMVSWWPGDGTFNDIVDANIGTNAGGTMFTTGKVGQAFLFDGSPNSFITLPNSPNMLPASNQLTIDAWVKPDFSVANQWDNILAKRDGCGAPGNSYNFGINKGDSSDVFGAVAFAMSSPDGGITRATSGGTTVPNDGQFHHAAATYDGSVMQVYLDGQLVGQAARSGQILATTSAAVISHHGGECGQRAVAAMDEIEFHDRALSASAIQNIVNAGSAGKCITCTPPPPDMISWWPGDGNADDIQDGNNGTLEGGATFGAGMVGQAFSFNGVNGGGGVNLGNVPAFDFTQSSSFTIDAWINSFGATVPPNDGQLIVSLNSNCSNTVQNLGISPPGETLFFQVRDANGVTAGPLFSPTAPSKNAWHHVAGVREVTDSGTTLKLYVDGVLVATAADPSTGPLALNTPDVIGRRNICGTTNTFNGLIDEVEIFNRALSASEIQAIVKADSAGKCKFPMEELTSLSPATLWIGLKNSDDQGTQFDLRTEVYINDTPVAEGETRCITGVTRNPSKAKEASVEFGPISGGVLASGDVLSLRVLTRIGTNPNNTKCSGPGGSHNNAVGLRLYYDAVSRPSRFGAEITPDPLTDFFLHSIGTDFFFDATPPTATPAKFKDSSGVNFAGGNPWKEIGTWDMTLP